MKKIVLLVNIAVITTLLFGENCLAQPTCRSSFSFIKSNKKKVAISAIGGHTLSELYNATNGFTWEAWVMLADTNTKDDIIIAVEDAAINEDIWLGTGISGGTGAQLNFRVRDNASGYGVYVNGATHLAPNRWYYITAVCDYPGGYIKLYQDGTLIGSTAITFDPSHRLTRNITTSIGNYNSVDTASINANIDEVKFWNGVRSPAQILTDSAGCTSFPQPGLLAYFRADEGSGTYSSSLINSNFYGTNTAGWGTNAPVTPCLPTAAMATPADTICIGDSSTLTINLSNLVPGSSWFVILSDGSYLSGTADSTGSGSGTHTVSPSATTSYTIDSLSTSTQCTSIVGTTTVVVNNCHLGVISNNPALAGSNIKIYPNPNYGNFTIQMDKTAGLKTIALMDITGRAISKVTLDGGATHFAIDNLEPGIYIISITTGGATTAKRVVVTK